MYPTRKPSGWIFCPISSTQFLVFDGGQRHGDVAGSLVDRGGATEGPRTVAPQGRSFVDRDRGDPHLVTDQVVVVLGVRRRRVDQLLDVASGVAGREGKQRAGLLDVQAADLVGHQARLARGDAHVFGGGTHDRPLVRGVRATTARRSRFFLLGFGVGFFWGGAAGG